jgi:hypothetical protein
MAEADRRIAATARGQHASFSRRQARAAGLTDAMLRSRVQSGTLLQPGPNVFSSSLAPASALAALWNVVLDIGNPVWVAGATACAVHGLDGTTALLRPSSVVVPRGRYVTRPDVEVRTAVRIDAIDTCVVDRLPVLSATRCIIELAATAGADELAAAIDGALRDRLTTEDFLRRRALILRGKGRPGSACCSTSSTGWTSAGAATATSSVRSFR